MSPSSILLRVLLSAALILNGISSAVASAQMARVATTAAPTADAHAQHAATAPAHSHDACHDHAATTSPEHDGPAAGGGHGKHGPACCQAGMCACHCAQQAQVAFVPPALASPQVAHAASVRAMSSAHESPRLPHLIRPPIRQAS